MSLPSMLLRLEGLAVFIAAIAMYASQSASGLMFVLLLLAPDLSAIGYLVNPRIGSYLYNAVHTYSLPIALFVLATIGGWTLGIQLALIWFAHIGMDRTVGYGLKYATEFKATHLQRV
ncbi:MAG: DUF4260 domain-containing protein [Burkholderiales bacterium]|nr:DUF4260 domain-containing protein [Anaerolineae bacterium]